MDHTFPAELSPFQAAAVWTMLEHFAQRIAQALRSALPLSAPQRVVLDMVTVVATEVLDAVDIADLRARLDALARDERLMQWEQALLEQQIQLSPAEPPALAPALERTWGSSPLAQECTRLFVGLVGVLSQIRLAEATILEDLDLPESVSSLLDDFSTPSELRNAILDARAGNVALLALFAPQIDPARWAQAPWLRHGLLEQVCLGFRATLRLLAEYPGAEVPEDLLPLAERLERRAIEAEIEEREQYLLPEDLEVTEDFAPAVLDALFGTSPPPPGVIALFND